MANNYIMRMKEELDQLTERYIKLEQFMNTPLFYDLTALEKELMSDQRSAMFKYLTALSTRYHIITYTKGTDNCIERKEN
mgnify:CR=1 FL=1